MPQRFTPLVIGQFYHIFNRGVEKRPTFTNAREYNHFLETISYYRAVTPPIRLSRFLTLRKNDREYLLTDLSKSPKLIFIHCYVFMPNHFHLLLSQIVENGISIFMKRVSDSYTRYFNTKNERVGPLFQGQFKAVRIESAEQLLHVSRYIHLNPYTSYIVRTLDEMLNYPWSSLREYRGGGREVCHIKEILDYFKTYEAYEEFLKNQADYQRKLEDIKHLLIEK